MPISPELAAVYSTAPLDKHYIETMELQHPGFRDGKRYITNQAYGWTGDLETGLTGIKFEFVPFAAIPPRQEDQASLTLQVAIDNASRELMDELEAAATNPERPIIIYYRVYLSNDPTTVQNDPPLKLDVMSVTANQQAVSFAASISNLRSIPFPAQLYTTELYPGLSR